VLLKRQYGPIIETADVIMDALSTASGSDSEECRRRRIRATMCCSIATIAAARRRTERVWFGVKSKWPATAAATSLEDDLSNASNARTRSACGVVTRRVGQLATCARRCMSSHRSLPPYFGGLRAFVLVAYERMKEGCASAHLQHQLGRQRVVPSIVRCVVGNDVHIILIAPNIRLLQW